MRRQCQVCGSTKLFKNISGLVCDQGHAVVGYIREDNQMEGPSAHVMRVRQTRKARKKKKATVHAKNATFYGVTGRYLYFQTVQLILRKQIAALCRVWKLPPEFEIICRDLWLLHVSSLSNPPPDQPFRRVFLGEQEEELNDPLDDKTQLSKDPKGKRKARSTSKNAEDSDDDESEESDHAGLKALLDELSDSDSNWEDEVLNTPPPPANLPSHTDADTNARAKPKSKKYLPKHPNSTVDSRGPEAVGSTIAILYVACWIMRIPVTTMDFIRLIESYDLPLLDSTLVLPDEIASYLSQKKRLLVSLSFAPTTSELWDQSVQLVRRHRRLFGVDVPVANQAPLLWRAVRAMLGSPVLYTLVKSLCAGTGIALSFHTDKRSVYGPPELILVSATVCVLKLIYGFDGRPRVPVDEDDPAFLMPRYESYMAALQDHWDARFRSKEELFSPRSVVPTTDFSDEDIDSYIAFAERALLPDPAAVASAEGERRRNGSAHIFARQFPLPSPSQYTLANDKTSAPTKMPYPIDPRLNDFPTYPPPRSSRSSPPLLRPGQSFPMYAPLHKDPTGAFPKAYELVLNVAAHWVGRGTEIDDVASCVGLIDKRLYSLEKGENAWWAKLGKRKGGGGKKAERAAAAADEQFEFVDIGEILGVGSWNEKK